MIIIYVRRMSLIGHMFIFIFKYMYPESSFVGKTRNNFGNTVSVQCI